ncbi:hypothetical protein F9C07_1865661 [Aspergillus flavus]|uniref:Transmembrane protein n=3 Tax=Aspergillus subgen. Circumdati TaxID=2720871 RepID=A0A7U2MXM5_ASPFN|nr:uncharacterized protein G4B84_010845 [Aspergillus flavus NRRL3357]EIT78224.1 hypothetical protein Ao3042_05579 [Aspergillus oryzae 3.042]KAB8245469.1 hypothetical protein BDV35DRAFT_259192 [Aspergillus flavus]KDE77744.1 hypothetical protein AO1008_03882 [Aspergillus oryzae 100-8]KAF7624353.1 hypothetical protein AFLA_008063 [Aspergillus flavus NRRL3357]QMW35354.1 hypothetical protein G4B84_010845 [Aspergillus flavus NRRL3357]|eukprot:EIT78224.1 hypothetical protein Ao3042_05579 [Aspergillus oryzae 3.042]
MPFVKSGLVQLFNAISYYGLISSFAVQVAAGGNSASASQGGYFHGQPMPVTCLNRTIDSGEHITDSLGKLQYIPFPTCKETSLPLALRYGVTETVNCTIDRVSDELYHLLEYYVHSDVPMNCRVPTAPLLPPTSSDSDDKAHEGEAVSTELSALSEEGPPYTPITFALQGTLQRSHLHIWTDMNVLMHNIVSTPKKNKRKTKKVAPGYAVAGTAYSVPEFELSFLNSKKKVSDEEKEAAAVAEAAREPWTAGHGTKVIREQPLTFTFHVSWVEGGGGIGWPSRGSAASELTGGTGFFSKLFFFVLAASLGAAMALYWERARRRGWRGDGILGVPSRGKGSVGVVYGNGGKSNGYGGYSASNVSMTGNGGGYGYGGFSAGKKD